MNANVRAPCGQNLDLIEQSLVALFRGAHVDCRVAVHSRCNEIRWIESGKLYAHSRRLSAPTYCIGMCEPAPSRNEADRLSFSVPTVEWRPRHPCSGKIGRASGKALSLCSESYMSKASDPGKSSHPQLPGKVISPEICNTALSPPPASPSDSDDRAGVLPCASVPWKTSTYRNRV